MKTMGWTPAKSVRERIAEVTEWTLNNGVGYNPQVDDYVIWKDSIVKCA